VAEKKDLDFPRHWVEFVDPEDETNLYKCDLTWLTSRWTCIWGRGCKGIEADSPDVGCCAYGAHIADKEDYDQVVSYIDQLTPDIWQNYDEGHGPNGMFEHDDDMELKTRAYKGACIFHNRNGFDGGDGCSLHILAGQLGVSYVKTKPQVCWELPIRRTFETVTRPDDVEITVIGIEEFTRRGWGAGGTELHWYCTTATEAHVGAQPVYAAYRDELVELMGKGAYRVLVEHCMAREAAIAAVAPDSRLRRALAIHPATPKPRDDV
jgi:hypothetical protein